jgi:hypothetical protein
MAEQFHLGVNETADPSRLSPGELQAAAGIYYRTNDDRAWLTRGSSLLFDTGGFGAPQICYGLRFIPFDLGPDVLLSRTGFTGGPAAILKAHDVAGVVATAQLDTLTSGDRMVDAHFNDRRYIALGEDQRGQVLSSKEGTPEFREWGLAAPQVAPTLAAQVAGASVRPTAAFASTGWTNPTNAFDSDADGPTSFAGGTLSAPGSAIVLELASWQEDTGSGRKLMVDWQFAGYQNPDDVGTEDDKGETQSAGAAVRVKFEKQDSASAGAWVTFYNAVHGGSFPPKGIQTDWNADGASTTSWARFRATFTYLHGSSTVTIRVIDVRIIRGGSLAAFSGNFLYFTSEYNQEENLAGPRSKEVTVALVAASGHNAVLMTLPPQQNDSATHHRIYRTVSDGTINTAGLIDEVPIAATTYLDDFVKYGPTVQPSLTFPLLAVGGLFFPRDNPPPALMYVWTHQGQLLGIDAVNQRSLRSSLLAYPESWPEIYVLPSIPMPEHDILIAGAAIFGFSVIATSGGMLRLDGVPRIQNGILQPGDCVRIAGAPGCVSYKAFCEIPWKGIPSIAWISPDQGICITNGHTWEFVSNDIDWSRFRDKDMSGFLLHWDKARRVLVFAYSLDGASENDTYFLGHLERQKDHGGIAWTGPTAGQDLTFLTSGNLTGGGHRLYSATHGVSSFTGVPIRRQDDPESVESIAFSLRSRRQYGPDWRAVSVLDGRLRHTDWGAGSSLALAWTSGRDGGAAVHESVKTVTVSLVGARGHQFDISRSGEWHEYTLSGSVVSGDKALLDMEVDGFTQGREGKVNAA